MCKLKNLCLAIVKKLFTREIITYVTAGVLTTLVNWICSYVFNNIIHIDENVNTVISWIAAVAFAYVINNKWVFLQPKENTRTESVKILKFVLARLFTLGVEEAGIFLFVKVLEISFWPVKIVLSVIVTVLNYVFSKLLIFLKKEEN